MTRALAKLMRNVNCNIELTENTPVTTYTKECSPVIKPLGVLLVLGVVAALLICAINATWRSLLNFRRGKRNRAVTLLILALGIFAMSAWAVYAVSPKGGRTVAQLKLPDHREFVVRHYRYGWLEYPKARFYARDTNGAWTSFTLISELVNPNATSLVLDASTQQVHVNGVGSYLLQQNEFVNIDGSRGTKRLLPPETVPDEENVYETS